MTVIAGWSELTKSCFHTCSKLFKLCFLTPVHFSMTFELKVFAAARHIYRSASRYFFTDQLKAFVKKLSFDVYYLLLTVLWFESLFCRKMQCKFLSILNSRWWWKNLAIVLCYPLDFEWRWLLQISPAIFKVVGSWFPLSKSQHHKTMDTFVIS